MALSKVEMPDDGDQLYDGRFVLRLKKRDEHAFNQFVLAYEERVFRLAWRMLGNKHEAEDLTQEVFVQVFRSIHTFRGDSKIGTWVYRITINLAKNRTKYLARRHDKAHSDITDGEPRDDHNQGRGTTTGETHRPDLDAMGNQAERAVVDCLQSLEPDYRQLLVLRDVEGLSYEEVGTITGLNAGTVKSRLHRARALLKAGIEERLGEKLK